MINYNNPVPNTPAKTNETIVINLIRMLIDGPEVSLNGSPTVSPTTAALCGSLPFPPSAPPSIYFLALSHAPPAFAINIAIITPLTKEPASIPPRAFAPNKNPIINGDSTANTPGTIIS